MLVNYKVNIASYCYKVTVAVAKFSPFDLPVQIIFCNFAHKINYRYSTMANKKYEIPEDDVMMVSEPAAEYAGTLTVPIPTQITVNIEDASMLKEIKRAISMIRGVVSVEKSPAMKSYERARADVKAGRIVKCKDKEDFFAKLGL